jgi:hypothetical protein
MKSAAVALLASSLLLGCFPHNPRARTYAKIGEGTAILAGIAISAFANTAADCDQMSRPGIDDSGCKSGAQWASTAGVTLILGGLLGFVATVSTAEEAAKPKPVEIKDVTPTAETKTSPARESSPAAGTGSDGAARSAGSANTNTAGSAAAAPSAPQH